MALVKTLYVLGRTIELLQLQLAFGDADQKTTLPYIIFLVSLKQDQRPQASLFRQFILTQFECRCRYVG